MNKWSSTAIGTFIGMAAGAAYLYLFAPARDTTFDEKYQSRLDWALAEGKKAGELRQQELLDELRQARISPPDSALAPTPVEPPVEPLPVENPRESDLP